MAAREAVEAGQRAPITRRLRESLDIWAREAINAVLGLGPVSAVIAVRLIADNGGQSVLILSVIGWKASGQARLVFPPGLPATLRSAGGSIEYDAACRCGGFAGGAADGRASIVAALYEARQGEGGLPPRACVAAAVCAGKIMKGRCDRRDARPRGWSGQRARAMIRRRKHRLGR